MLDQPRKSGLLGKGKLTPIPLARMEHLSHGRERQLDPAHGEARTGHSTSYSVRAVGFCAPEDREEEVYPVSQRLYHETDPKP